MNFIEAKVKLKNDLIKYFDSMKIDVDIRGQELLKLLDKKGNSHSEKQTDKNEKKI